MFGRKKKSTATANQPGTFIRFFKQQTHTDTVVFVHGILGHYVTTWGLFPKLLSEDPDLPELDVLLWGYRTGWISSHHELKVEGQHLVTRPPLAFTLNDTSVPLPALRTNRRSSSGLSAASIGTLPAPTRPVTGGKH
jgi:hypothetical protein